MCKGGKGGGREGGGNTVTRHVKYRAQERSCDSTCYSPFYIDEPHIFTFLNQDLWWPFHTQLSGKVPSYLDILNLYNQPSPPNSAGSISFRSLQTEGFICLTRSLFSFTFSFWINRLYFLEQFWVYGKTEWRVQNSLAPSHFLPTQFPLLISCIGVVHSTSNIDTLSVTKVCS